MKRIIQSGRETADIAKVILIVIVILLAVYGGVMTYRAGTGADSGVGSAYAVIDVADPENYAYLDYTGDVDLDDASYAQVYSIEDNPGYEKQVMVDGDFRFTIFTSTAVSDGFHPDFLCFVEYIGARADLIFGYTGSLQNMEDDGSAWDTEVYGWEDCALLYIGNLDDDCSFTITMYALDETAEISFWTAQIQAAKGKSDLPGEFEYAVITGSTVIAMGDGGWCRRI